MKAQAAPEDRVTQAAQEVPEEARVVLEDPVGDLVAPEVPGGQAVPVEPMGGLEGPAAQVVPVGDLVVPEALEDRVAPEALEDRVVVDPAVPGALVEVQVAPAGDRVDPAATSDPAVSDFSNPFFMSYSDCPTVNPNLASFLLFCCSNPSVRINSPRWLFLPMYQHKQKSCINFYKIDELLIK